jgi:predicted dehydrogenase
MENLKVAFIGAGPTMEQYIKVLNDIQKPKIEFCGIFNRTSAKAQILQKKYKIKYLCKSIDELYKKTEADIVFSVVSVENIGKVTLKASNYPWKIFTEKPFGINYKESLKLEKILGERKNKIFVALNRAFFSSTLNIVKLLEKEKSKRIINVYDQQDISLFTNKKYSNRFKKNLMFSNSIHLFTLVKLLARGKEKKIETIMNYKKNNERYLIKKIIFTSGDVVILNSIWNRPGPWKLDLSTSSNFFSLNPLEQLYIRSKKNRSNILINTSNEDIKYKPGFKKQIDFFLKEFKNKKKFNFQFSLDVMKLIQVYFFKN